MCGRRLRVDIQCDLHNERLIPWKRTELRAVVVVDTHLVVLEKIQMHEGLQISYRIVEFLELNCRHTAGWSQKHRRGKRVDTETAEHRKLSLKSRYISTVGPTDLQPLAGRLHRWGNDNHAAHGPKDACRPDTLHG